MKIPEILVNDPLPIPTDADAIMIVGELVEILPIDSKEGQLYKITDSEGKGVLIRIKCPQ